VKRSRPLERRTPLAPGRALQRAPWAWAPRAVKAARRPAKRPQDTGPSQKVRQAVYARDEWLCVLAGLQQLGPCVDGLSLQHRVPRGTGGSTVDWINDPANLATVCGDGTRGHHGWLEQHRTAAERLGLIVRRARTADATWQRLQATPVYVRGLWFLPDGPGWRATLPPNAEATDD
jgi:5-methylcytosine-specific restriction protein A